MEADGATSQRIGDVESRITNHRIESERRFTAAETDLATLKKTLYGNGQMGVIKELDLKVTNLEKQVIKILAWATAVWTLLISGHIALEQFFKK